MGFIYSVKIARLEYMQISKHAYLKSFSTLNSRQLAFRGNAKTLSNEEKITVNKDEYLALKRREKINNIADTVMIAGAAIPALIILVSMFKEKLK